ncbi:probable LRR receptor-like serine/threonine-protein kinase At3g47570 [Gastrolobium bilobum]|uniref:probable LRR receptor-like serine/threonine-protein kinase At3g47570 n=1 Tax=Gastrolobium bilobum TaxID=150636 RepID=UPI002AB25013|nr:probable LRR receptor-like serine/threonine-protein kinase At3g47570 [Gastrolobium bilobum]XP_061357695.1 probable LRR receptor-like serine/threonine-protein kinase At3g47570 [Gastrolobium bilobum]
MIHEFCSTCLHLFLLFNLNSLWFSPNTTASASGNETDHLALLKFKESISNDPYGILVSWNSSTHFCNWHGITCSPMYQRVTELNLQGYHLYGFISPQVGNLSSLRNLNLEDNSFYGKIPQELGLLLKLQQLSLTNNSLTGEIPTNLTSCTNLRGLQLRGNNLIGKIPIEMGSLQKLQQLSIGRNNLSGGIPPFIGNLSSLTGFSANYNNLEGDIPQELCSLKNLTKIAVGVNKLSGTFPSCLYNMSSLTIISVDGNQFNGSLPPYMFHTLPNLQVFLIGGNQISGPIPISVANASVLQLLDIQGNHFKGQVPSLGKLQDLKFLGSSLNNLGDNSTRDLEFLKSLTNCSKLYMLDISNNNFGGSLPNSLGNLSSQLSQLYLGGNQISGKIPMELGNLVSLILLSMGLNHFEGVIPSAFGKFQKLQYLELYGNNLSGNIPTFIGNLSQLFHLRLGHNILEGNIHPSIGNCQNLQYLDLSQNKLTGTIPLEVFSLSSLTNLLDLSQNSLSGNLPDEVGLLKNIDALNVSENNLSGNIPETIGECTSLEYLYLQGNFFHGIIPTSLPSLKVLRHLDLSRNRLYGSIPKGLQNISFLEYLNVSFNLLEGEIPTEGVFRNPSQIALTRNNKLCGGVSELHLPPCPVKGEKHAKHHNFKLIAATISVVAFLLILSSILTFYRMRKKSKKPSSNSPTIDQLAKVSYQNLHRGTDGFSTRNLIGSGSFGSVYKGTIEPEDRVVAIKVLNLQKKGVHKSFIAECNALKNIRHRNLIRILTCCSSTDFKGQEFKALVFEYMSNRSLESWLHPEIEVADQPRSLNLEERLNIIIDVASAFHYLHYECEQAVIHCDLKPSNVLLDDCMVAHVSDFGLARLLPSVGVSLMQSSTIGIKGTVGYAPPEYGMGLGLSIEGDMYSFGILVLEMLTGRRPTNEMFKDGHTLHNYVKISISNNLVEIVDPTILPNELERDTDNKNLDLTHPNMEKCLLSLFRIALACSLESPKERMSIIDVTKELNLIKSFFLSGV